MLLEYEDFKREISKNIKQVFAVWGDNLKSFREQIRQQASRRPDRQGLQFLNLERNPLRDRLDQIISFRHHHQKLKQIISKTLNKDGPNISGSNLSDGAANNNGNAPNVRNFEEQALNDINEAYSLFLNINVLNVSKEGQEVWDITKKSYDNKIDKVES